MRPTSGSVRPDLLRQVRDRQPDEPADAAGLAGAVQHRRHEPHLGR